MGKALVDLLWRDVAATPRGRGPRARMTTTDVVTQAVELADAEGLPGLSIRRLAQTLGISTMSVYTHVNSRDDLLVLMADQVNAEQARPEWVGTWDRRIRTLAESNLSLLLSHPWLVDMVDLRTALGPGTIAKYDHELHAFDGTRLEPLERDAALTFVLDFVTASAASKLAQSRRGSFEETWEESSATLSRLIGDRFPLAREVGRAAGERHGSPYDAGAAWEFGLARVIAGLADILDD